MPRELEWGTHAKQVLLPAGHSRDPLAHANRIRKIHARHLAQLRLVVEKIDVRGRAGLEKVDDPLGPRREMQPCDARAAGRRCKRVLAKQGRQGHGTETQAGASEKSASCESRRV